MKKHVDLYDNVDDGGVYTGAAGHDIDDDVEVVVLTIMLMMVLMVLMHWWMMQETEKALIV